MTEITIASFTEVDLDWLLAIEARARAEGFVRGNDQAGHEYHLTRPDRLYLKILSDGTPIGFVIIGGIGGEDQVIELGRIIIDEPYRGTGQEALRVIIDYIFTELDAHKICLDTLDHNQRGQHIYEKLGFVREGKIREGFLMNNTRHDMVLYGLLRREWSGT
jgi:RimJ/RimL family protein N-acetyltransferase